MSATARRLALGQHRPHLLEYIGKETARVEEIEEGSSLTCLLLQVEEEGLRFVNPSPFSRGPQPQP